MSPSDAAPIIAIALRAAAADGSTGATEQAAIDAAVAKLAAPDVMEAARALAMADLAVIAGKLSDDAARRAAFETALAITHADGSANDAERKFLVQLREALGMNAQAVADQQQVAGALAGASIGTGTPPKGAHDDYILQQAILTGAIEVLPDRLANIAILPLQLRLVYTIGQRHGQRLDLNQVKDLAATLGIGAAAQSVEGVVMKVLGGLAGGLLGGMVGGAARIATGAAVTFATTYALGHVADQYYTQGRNLSRADLQQLFARFQGEAKTIWPKVQQQVQTQSGSLNVQNLLASLRG